MRSPSTHGIGIVGADGGRSCSRPGNKLKATWKDAKGSKIDSDRDMKDVSWRTCRDTSKKGVVVQDREAERGARRRGQGALERV